MVKDLFPLIVVILAIVAGMLLANWYYEDEDEDEF